MFKVYQMVVDLHNLRSDKRGVTALEYGLIAALIAAVIVGFMGNFGGALANAFNNIANRLWNVP